MDENDLLKSFLAGFPESTHPFDRGRFIAYAVECVKNGHYINSDAMRKHGLSDECVDDYEIAFTWIREAMDYLSSKGAL